MGHPTGITWTDATWNPIGGCSIESPGCNNCYAQRLAGTRLAKLPLYAGTTDIVKGRPVFNGRLTVAPDDADVWTWPLRWRGSKTPRRGPGARSLIFVGDMADLFHERRPVADIDRVFAIMALGWRHDFHVLTKRPDVMERYCLDPGTPRRMWHMAGVISEDLGDYFLGSLAAQGAVWGGELPWPLRNLWIGASCERQQEADKRIPALKHTPANVRFLSLEPLLGPIDLSGHLDGIDQVITGGESGPHARPANPDWFRSIRDQCQAAGIAYFHKQNGPVGAGRMLDGREHGEFPR